MQHRAMLRLEEQRKYVFLEWGAPVVSTIMNQDVEVYSQVGRRGSYDLLETQVRWRVRHTLHKNLNLPEWQCRRRGLL